MSPKYNSFRLFDFNVKDVKVEPENRDEDQEETEEGEAQVTYRIIGGD